MEKLEPLDILQELTPAEKETGELMDWMVDSKTDEDGTEHVIFQADTPKEILEKFKRDYKLLTFKTNGDYTLAPEGVMNKWKALRLAAEEKN